MTRNFVKAALAVVLITTIFNLRAHAAAAPAVLSVEGVVSPAWVERADGKREPLAVGMDLSNKEKVITGAGARALLRMSEGSGVKLGENALLVLDELTQKAGPKGGVVGASLEVVRGAFRFTTGILGKPTAQRDVRVKVNVITAGIRGTDVWGKPEPERDVVCLLEGQVSVTHGTNQFTMSEPNSFYIAPRQGPAQPVATVSAAQVKQWSAETEIASGTGSLRRGGKYHVEALTGADFNTAQRQSNNLRESGFPAYARETDLAGTRFEVRIDGIADLQEARALTERVRRLGFKQARPVE